MGAAVGWVEGALAGRDFVYGARVGERYDVVVVGGGIVGLATARALVRRAPGLGVLLLEKEARFAQHQSGRNSGVVHRGLYYTPGSLKAELCRRGAQALEHYCRERGLPYEELGKLIVAADAAELGRLDELHERARKNGVPGVRRITGEELRELEPHVAGVAALVSPKTAVTDYSAVASSFADEAREGGAELRLGEAFLGCVSGAGEELVRTARGELHAKHVVLCPGLWADRVARSAGLRPSERVLPFRGEYARLRAERTHLVNGLVYPTPDPRLPFLGVHFTPTVSGAVDVGPSALLALARDRHGRSFAPRDAWGICAFRGTWRLGAQFLGVGVKELWRARRRAAFVAAAARLVPAIVASDLEPAAPGLRAQLVDPRGRLLDDFEIRRRDRVTCVLNAPSPAATSSLTIAEAIVDQVLDRKKVPARQD